MELENYDKFPQNIPLIIEDEIFLYPFMIAPLFLSNEENIKAIEYAIENNKLVIVAVSKQGSEDKREEDSFYDVGVIGNIMRKVSLPDGKIKVLFQGLAKGSIKEFNKENPLFVNVDIFLDVFQRENIAGLEHQIATMKAEGVASGVGVASTAGISDEVGLKRYDLVLK